MGFQFSRFATRFSGPTGTRQLMDDLGEVIAGDADLINLGGGNPAQISELQQTFRQRLQKLIDNNSFDRISSQYDSPQGNQAFIEAVAKFFRTHYQWPLEPQHIAITNGSQASFFALFNIFAGRGDDGVERTIRLPLTPEYIGYGDLCINPAHIVSARPSIELREQRRFKYHVDFDAFELSSTTGAVCVSRPTNPTGNVLTDAEMRRLVERTADADIPLIVDNAYGLPFPGIVFRQSQPIYAEHIIYCLSLSKLGLPGLRTGIIIAPPEVIEVIRSLNAIFTLAGNSLGAALATGLMADGEVLKLANDVVRPHYVAQLKAAEASVEAEFADIDYRLHVAEGAIFLWLWFPHLPITAQTLYERLKARNVLVIPGQHFFPGLADEWSHRHECIRVSYAQNIAAVRHGLGIIAEEVRRARQQADGTGC